MEKIDSQKLKENADKAAELLKKMAHPSRLMVLCHLVDKECSVSELNQTVPLSQSALSQHLASLRDAGLVATRRASQVIYYRLNSPAVSAILETLYNIYCTPPENKEK